MARLLLLTHIFPPAVDGGSRVISKTREYLKKQGHQVLVITTNCTSTDDFARQKHKTISQKYFDPNIHRLSVSTFFHRPLKLISKIFPVFTTFSKGPILKHLPLKKIISFKPDIIIAGPFPTTMVIYAKILQNLTGAKLLINPCFHPKDQDFRNPLLISTLNQADYLWCLTNYEKKYLQSQFNITKPQYIVQGLGVDPNFMKTDKVRYPDNPNIIFLANFAAHKRTELLFEVFNKIQINYPLTTLTLLGQKTLYYPHIQKSFESLPIKTQKNIKFIFSPTLEQIKNFLDNASFLVLPSVHESFGLVFVESLARGKAIIGADTPQTNKVINSLNGGLLFKTDDANSLYQTIIKLIESPKLRQKLGQDGYQTVKKYYTWDKIINNLCKKLAI